MTPFSGAWLKSIYIMKLIITGYQRIIIYQICLTHYQTTNFRFSQTERICRRYVIFDENGRKLSKRVENAVGKREIARYEQFLLFPQCFFKRLFTQGCQKVLLCGNGLKIELIFYFSKYYHISVDIPHRRPWVRIYQAFSRTFFAFFSKTPPGRLNSEHAGLITWWL